MDVSNLLGHLLINPTSLCLRQNLQVPQIYFSSLVSCSNDNSPSLTLLVPNQQKEEETKSDGDDDSDDCEDDESSNDADYGSGTENEEGKSAEASRKGKGKSRPKCIHRTRYSREEYRCESCPYSCTTEKAFLKHVRQCTGKDTDLHNSPLSCPVCGKDRKNETSLSVHMVKHKSGKHFCCDLCKFKSIQLKKIIQHRRMHTGEKPHLCPHCSYRSSRRDNLRSHVRRMHNEDDLHCDTFTPRKILFIPKQAELVK
ncbi:RE1-silencing transcription factor-like [Anoplophora glabripennis]|uniref:RE1-silencing transcription factor-like n=1 Tax=Anoplophora glabripennis TaxID=217634 RepID=UPI0008754BAF|nr:RE1-silencing transcription factor-like [Anoplophora glabripennis]